MGAAQLGAETDRALAALSRGGLSARVVRRKVTLNAVVDAVREQIASSGPSSLEVDDLTEADLSLIDWSGNRGHIRSVASYLLRVPSGEVEYLAVRAPGGQPVAKGCVDYSLHDDAGTLEQLATHPELQGLGLGSRLVTAAEDRIRSRGLRGAIIGVEVENVRAAHLYERLGYKPCGHGKDSWEREDEDGNVSVHEADIVWMRKDL